MILKRTNFTKWTCSLLFLLSLSAVAQKSEVYKTFKKKYPDAPVVRLEDKTTYRISINKEGNLDIKQDLYEEDLYLDRSANLNSKRSLSYTSFFDLSSIEAASMTYEGNQYVENKVEDFTEKNDLDDSFYDDSKQVSFIYPKLGEGNKTKLSFSYTIKNPRFLGAFYFGDYYPIAKNQVTLIVDKNIEMEFKTFNMDDANVDFQQTKKGKNIIYTWTKNNIEQYKTDPGAPSFKTFVPHVIPVIKSYKVKRQTKTVLDGVNSLYNWYYSLVEGVNTQDVDPELKALTENLIKDKENDLEKVKAIYYWTQKNIKYIAFEYALGGFIPREANDVFKKKYGDCKDNSSILAEMLEIAGLEGNLTWIGTRKIPYTYEEVPTPAVDNHMILSYEYQGETYYLDATGRFTPIDYPTAFIQGKEALVSKGKDDYVIKKVPIMGADKTVLRDSSYVKIQGDELLGTSKANITGYLKGDLFYSLEQIKKEKDLIELFNARFRKGNNKFLISKISEENKYDYEKDYVVNYDFNIKDYAQQYGDELYVNPHFHKVASQFRIEKDRKRPVEYQYKRTFDFINVIEVPEGYTVDYIPENVSLSNDLMSVSMTYEQKENTIVCTSKAVLDYVLLDLDQQKEVNALIKKATKAYKEIIILKKQ